jgi:hypothetical protein
MNDRTAFLMLLAGALAAGYFVAGMFFFRFWRQTRDRLFMFFGVAFCLLALQRLALSWATIHDSGTIVYYLLRLLAFALILIAILDKNRAARG